MSDTYSNNLRVRLPQTGAYNGTWGSTINSDTFNLLDVAITGRRQIALSALTYSLAALVDGTDSDSRYFCLQFTGAPSGTVTVTMPASLLMKSYLIDNQCGQDIIFTYGGGRTVTVSTGVRKLIWCDGTNCDPVYASASDASTLGGIPSADWARTIRTATEVSGSTYLTNAFGTGVRNANTFQTVTEAATTTIDARVGNAQILTLSGNRIMAAPSNATDGEIINLLVVQDGTGSRTLTWNSIFVFENGIAPVLATVAGGIDYFVMIYNSALAKWIVGHFGNITTGTGTTYSYTLAENTLDWNLLARVGTVGSAITVNVTVNQGVIIQASTSGTPAMDLSGLPAGSTVNLINSGYILGKGGKGGIGGSFARAAGDAYSTNQGTAGRNGGNAVLGVGTGRTFNITNTNGFIWGGGGGGGGGGFDSVVGNVGAAGGGGGGGAGGGDGGDEGAAQYSSHVRGTQGSTGSTGPSGAGGAGGGGASSGTAGYAGGAGGGFGAAGTAGSVGADANNGAAGTAGKAIELNGGSAPTFTGGSGSPNIKGAVS